MGKQIDPKKPIKLTKRITVRETCLISAHILMLLQTDRMTIQKETNRTENSGIDQQMQEILIYDQGGASIQWENGRIFNKLC